MNSIQNFLMASAVILLLARVRVEAKPTPVLNLDGGNFGPIENKGNEDAEEMEVQGFGGGGGSGGVRNGGMMDPNFSAPWGSGSRQDLFRMSQLIKIILDEIRNRRLSMDAEIGRPRESLGKRQIVYRQCFFNPISCF